MGRYTEYQDNCTSNTWNAGRSFSRGRKVNAAPTLDDYDGWVDETEDYYDYQDMSGDDRSRYYFGGRKR